jgi:hypothetical protein
MTMTTAPKAAQSSTSATRAARKLTLQEIADAINNHGCFDGMAFRSSNFVILQYFARERETALSTKDAQAYLDRLNSTNPSAFLRHDEEVA